MSAPPKPMALIILDGWGYSENPNSNAIAAAQTPVWDHLWMNYPHTLIQASGAEVGLPGDQMGNSEVGHLNIGAGRVVYQEFTRVSRAIKTASFFTNKTLTDAVDLARDTGKAVHILGLLSPGGVHSHETHIYAMAELAAQRGLSQFYLHAFLDGRDTPPRSADNSIKLMEEKFAQLGKGRFASIIGRYYAMDRDHRWPRIQVAYELITRGQAEFEAPSARRGLEMAYDRDENDEFVKATRVVPPGKGVVYVNDGDVVIFMNFRSDRARQITRPFIEPGFSGFDRGAPLQLGAFVSLTEYNSEFDIPVAYPPERLPNGFGEYIAQLGLRQLRLAETEKYAHVTFFFNGGVEKPFNGEDRILVPSPLVATYDLKPEMSALEVTDQFIRAIESRKYDVIICNYANPDMVGHTGNFNAAVRAIEVVDDCLGKVCEKLHEYNGELLITADHGNAEQMRDENIDQVHTAHTTNLVPLIYMGRPAKMADTGSLSDVAPTMLQLMGLERPSEMSGTSLLCFDCEAEKDTPPQLENSGV